MRKHGLQLQQMPHPWVETSAYTGCTIVLQTGDLESREESYIHSGRAETYIAADLAREANFNGGSLLLEGLWTRLCDGHVLCLDQPRRIG